MTRKLDNMPNRRINLTNDKIGLERREEILDGISDNGTYLPKAVHYDDIDRSFIDFVDKDVDLTFGDTKVPVFFMSIQKWTDFTKSWGSKDEQKDLKMPFLTVVRNPDVQQGTSQNKFMNIPGRRNYTYYKVPTFTNGRVGMDLYKVPQPTSVDMTFHIRFFSNRMQELNSLHNIIQRRFNALQYYININGHPMPLSLESVQDESKVDEMDSRKYYVQTFEVLCKAYILNEKDFDIVPTIDRSMLSINGGGVLNNNPKLTKNINTTTNDVSYDILFNHKSTNAIEISITEDTVLDSATTYNLIDLETKYYINNVITGFPIAVKRSDVLRVDVERVEVGTSTLKLVGYLT